MKSRREILEEFVAQDPSESFSRYALALELEKEKRVHEAVEHLREVISRDPGYTAAYQQLGRLLGRIGLLDDARDIYQRGIEAARASGDHRSISEMQDALEMIE
jgi:tetratricopeptide (TPR) repeat protein